METLLSLFRTEVKTTKMGKQKVVLKLYMEDAKKKSKALKTVAGLHGVLSASLEGQEKIVVEGDGVDCIALTNILRKKMRSVVELLSVNSIDESKEKNKEPSVPEVTEEKQNVKTIIWPAPYDFVPPYGRYHYEVREEHDRCRIM